MRDGAYTGVARVSKRCPHCRKMVPVGAPAVFRSITTETSWGFNRGGYIGARVGSKTHAYHADCAPQAPEMAHLRDERGGWVRQAV